MPIKVSTPPNSHFSWSSSSIVSCGRFASGFISRLPSAHRRTRRLRALPREQTSLRFVSPPAVLPVTPLQRVVGQLPNGPAAFPDRELVASPSAARRRLPHSAAGRRETDPPPPSP